MQNEKNIYIYERKIVGLYFQIFSIFKRVYQIMFLKERNKIMYV